ncbi:MAG: hypothetical protein AAFP85_06870 [Pseudomonadota bacterium]
MNAARHINFTPTDGATAVTTQSLVQLAKIGEMLANPVRFFHPDHTVAATGGLQEAQLVGLCSKNEIGKRLNAVLADRMGIATLDLRPSAVSIDAFALVTASDAAIDAFLRQVTAVCLQQSIRNCVLKADRERVRAILGDDAYNTALREAPFFYADLAIVTDINHFADEPAKPALNVGATAVQNYVATIDSGLAQIFTWRLPRALIDRDALLDTTQLKSFTRLLASKGPHKTGRV